MTEGSEEVLGLDRRKALLTAGGALTLAVGAVGLVGAVGEYDEMLEAVRQADKIWFPLCLGGLLLAYVVTSSGTGTRPGWAEARSSNTGQSPASSSPASERTSSAPRPGRSPSTSGPSTGPGADVHESARRVLGLNALEWAVLGGSAAAAGALVLAGLGPDAPLAMAVGWLVVVPACLAAAVWFGLPGRSRRLTDAPAEEPEALGRNPRAWVRWAAVELQKALADGVGAVVVVRELFSHPLRYRAGLLGFPVYWAGQLLLLYAALRAFIPEPVDPIGLVLAFATGYAASSLPLPTGGSGAIEAAMTFSLHAVGVPLAPALLGVLVYRLFSFWLPIVPALLLLPAVRSLPGELRRVGRESDADSGADAGVRA
ncbi:MAG: lysylphosphatidylglycerol synthase transmembrane domain-containing protein [Gaiellaceae bacterium]